MQSQSLLKRSWNIRKEKIHYGWDKAKRMKICYLFLAPYAVLFTTFFILPIVTSIYFGFTYYNILEPAPLKTNQT